MCYCNVMSMYTDTHVFEVLMSISITEYQQVNYWYLMISFLYGYGTDNKGMQGPIHLPYFEIHIIL
jgi:hypothetical protein